MLLVRLCVLTLAGACFACFANPTDSAPARPVVDAVACAAPDVSADCVQTADLWKRIRENLRLAGIEHPAVDAELTRFAKSPQSFVLFVEGAAPFLRYVADRVEFRGLPTDIVLLPFIESGYQPGAESAKSAKGLWQLMPVTAQRFGLQEDWWFDPRLDLGSSTRAALDYLTLLESRFAGDWLLALAAYNAGEGRVSRAIAKNRESGRPTDFWSLDLPKETLRYVPRLLAMARIVAQPDVFGLDLPTIADSPYLERVRIEGALDVRIAAELARISVDTIGVLNPGLKRAMTSPAGPDYLFLPADSGRHLRKALARLARNEDPRYRRVIYIVRSGDNLWTIAKHFGVPIRSLAGWNDLMLDEVIRPGHKLDIWT